MKDDFCLLTEKQLFYGDMLGKGRRGKKRFYEENSVLLCSILKEQPSSY
jgi:hypothetical protein